MKPVMLVMIFFLSGHEPVEIQAPAPSMEACQEFVLALASSYATVNGSNIRLGCVPALEPEGERPQRRRGQGTAA